MRWWAIWWCVFFMWCNAFNSSLNLVLNQNHNPFHKTNGCNKTKIKSNFISEIVIFRNVFIYNQQWFWSVWVKRVTSNEKKDQFLVWTLANISYHRSGFVISLCSFFKILLSSCTWWMSQCSPLYIQPRNSILFYSWCFSFLILHSFFFVRIAHFINKN